MRDGAVRSRLGVIRAAVPTVFRYCCAHGTSLGINELPQPGHSTLFFLLLGMVQIVYRESENRMQDGKCLWLQDYPQFQVAGRAASPTKTTEQNYAASENIRHKHPLPTSATNIRHKHPPQTSVKQV